jgi:hypothetical protein
VQSKGAKILAVVFFLKTPIPTIKLNYSWQHYSGNWTKEEQIQNNPHSFN